MRTEDAFRMNREAMARGSESKVFDWDKAAKIINDERKKYPDLVAVAGLQDDMEWTSDVIYRDGKCVNSNYTYLASIWAIPVLVIDDGDEIPCWKMERETEWDASTTWPESAKNILRS